MPQANHASEGHEKDIYALQLWGRYLISGGLDKTIRIWDLDTCRLIGEPLRGHRQEISCLQFDPRRAENVIFSGGYDGELICWRFSTGKILNRVNHAHGLAILCLRVNGTLVITGSTDMTIKIWSSCTLSADHLNDRTCTASIRPLATLTGHDGAVNAIDCSGDTVVSASADRTIRVWSIAQKKCVCLVDGPHSFGSVYVDGQTIVAAGDTALKLYNDRLELKGEQLPHDSRVRAVQGRFENRSTEIIVSGSWTGLVKIWRRAAPGNWHVVMEGALGKSRVVALDFDDRRVTCCSQDTKIVGWDFANGNPSVIDL